MPRRRRAQGRRPGQTAAPPAPKPGARKRLLLTLTMLTVVGLVVGGGISLFFPPAGFFAVDRARAALLDDTGAGLERAAAYGDDEDPAVFATAALAHVLLAAEHGGGQKDREQAARLLQSSLGFVAGSPEGLYARVLLKRVGSTDDSLDDDLEKKAEERAKRPVWLLARATRALDRGQTADGLELLQKAALGTDAPRRAQHELARFLLARGDYADARAVANRLIERAPEHAGGHVVHTLAAVLDDLREESDEERAVKLKQVRQRTGGDKRKDGPPRPGDVDPDQRATASLALWRTPEEDAALAALDTVDERDAPQLALFLEALAAGHGDDELAASLRARVVAAAARVPGHAIHQVELSLLDGDVATAEELLGTLAELAAGSADVQLQQARLRALKLLPDDELRRRAGGARSVTSDGITLPFGRLAFDPAAAGLPWVVRFDPSAVPDADLLAVLRGPDEGEARGKKLDAVVRRFSADAALARGDLTGATAAAAAARALLPADADLSLLDARIALRQGNREAARAAADAAVAAAPTDPAILLRAARAHYDNEGYVAAKKTLRKINALGFKSPGALALEAMIESRAGDAKSAQEALAQARGLSPNDAEIVGAEVLLRRDEPDLGPARDAADRLFAMDQLKTTDPILRAWQADAVARTGDGARAEAVLEELLAARPTLADAHLHLGTLRAATRSPANRAAAVEHFAKAALLAPGGGIAAEATTKKAALEAGPPPKTKPKKPKR